jgi:outer membrane protein assembly factor BamB
MSRAVVFALGPAILLAAVPVIPAQSKGAIHGTFSQALTLTEDSRVLRNFEILPLYMEADGWPTAIEILQDVLDGPEDTFVPVVRMGPDGKETTAWVGARTEALRLLASLPKDGRAAYETAANPRAKELLDAARKVGDWPRITAVAQRYPFTPAGRDAARQLGLHHLDRGDLHEAARWFQLWLQRDPDAAAHGPALFAAWLALIRSGLAADADMVWQSLQTRFPKGLVLHQRKVSLADLKKQFDDASPVAAVAGTWPLYAGNATRTGTAATLPAPDAVRWTADAVHNTEARALLDNAIRGQEARPQPVLSGSFPIALGDKVAFRAAGELRLVAADTGKPVWQVPLDGSLDRILADPSARLHVDAWVGYTMKFHPHILLENTTVGCLSSDGRRVFVVDDLAALPFVPRGTPPRAMGTAFDAPRLAAAVQRSRLRAVDAATGATLWEVGGDSVGKTLLVDDCYFLGPPLPVQGRLYGMVESAGVLYLVGLDPATGKLLMQQRLASPQNRLPQDGGRRLQALHLSYDQGVLVCPTNGGAVFAYDLVNNGLLWASAYRVKPLAHGPRLKGLRPAKEIEIELIPNLRSPWQVTAPVIVAGKVYHAAADSPVLECLNLHDGARVWKIDRNPDDHYFAGVHRDLVVIVGRKQCRAVRAADGQEVWRIDTGSPTGQGSFVDGSYCLPLKTGILKIDLAKGKPAPLQALPEKQTPGNLLVVGDVLVSQTPTAVVALGPAR